MTRLKLTEEECYAIGYLIAPAVAKLWDQFHLATGNSALDIKAKIDLLNGVWAKMDPNRV